jgi:hypothetical protein
LIPAFPRQVRPWLGRRRRRSSWMDFPAMAWPISISRGSPVPGNEFCWLTPRAIYVRIPRTRDWDCARLSIGQGTDYSTGSDIRRRKSVQLGTKSMSGANLRRSILGFRRVVEFGGSTVNVA